MSLVVMNDKTKVEDQARISRDLAETIGWRVASGTGYPEPDGVYTDNSTSAWKRNRKRPAWEQMLADVKTGKIDAIVVYHGDRLMRQPRDLEDLIELADGRGIRLAAPTGMRNLDNTDDRFVLRILVAQACMESDNMSRRRKAQYERWRMEGRSRPGGRGGRCYGFETDGITHRAAECAYVCEMADRVLAGESVNSVARDLTARGARSVTGHDVTYSAVKRMLMNPRYAGLMPDGESAAAWGPVLDRQKWERVRLVLSAKAGEFGYASNARRHLLSGIATCGECGAPLGIKSTGQDQVPGYACRRTGCGKVFRSAPALDLFVTAAVLKRLANPANPEGRAMPVDRAAEWAALQRERAETESLLGDFTASAGRARPLWLRLDQIDERMAELRTETEGTARSALLHRYAGITREQWEALPLDVRRAMVAACVRVTVLRAGKRGREFRPQDVRLDPA